MNNRVRRRSSLPSHTRAHSFPSLGLSSFQLDTTAMTEVSPREIVLSELADLWSLLRRHPRWGDLPGRKGSVSVDPTDNVPYGTFGKGLGLRVSMKESLPSPTPTTQEKTLSEKFSQLRDLVNSSEDIKDIPAPILLGPFLEVIRSGDTNGILTTFAVNSVEKFLRYQVLDAKCMGIPNAVRDITRAATRCRFEAGDSASDEAVLLRILQLAETVVLNQLGQWLEDAALCEVMETGLSILMEEIKSKEVLRKAAEKIVCNMAQRVFQRLKDLDNESDPEGLRGLISDPLSPGLAPSSAQHLHVVLNPETTPNEPPAASIAATMEMADSSTMETSTMETATLDTAVEMTEEHHSEKHLVSTALGTTVEESETSPKSTTIVGEEGPGQPYGIPAIRELLRVLVALVNPHDNQYTDQVRLVALGVLQTILETSGKTLDRFFSLRGLVTEDLCKHLFQLTNTESLPLLAQSLRTAEMVLRTLPTRTRFQRELFISILQRRLILPSNTTSSSRNSSGMIVGSGIGGGVKKAEARELICDSLIRMVLEHTVVSEVWVNYDCEIGAEDMLERTVILLCQYTSAEAARIAPGASKKAVEGLTRLLKSLAGRALIARPRANSAASVDATLDSPEVLMQQKRQKRLLQQGAEIFNENPREGIKFVQDHGLVAKPEGLEPADYNAVLARFLKTTPLLNKQILGEFLSKKQNIQLLEAFVGLFDFHNKRVDEAMRLLLEGFRLPGEAQLIERIMECFSKLYFNSGPPEIATQDATFILSFSVIMLNTDLHNPQVKRRMTLEDYMKNLRNVNDGRNFAPEYLVAIYEAIRDNEIIMPQERDGQQGFEFSWREMARKARIYSPGKVCITSAYDRDLFEAIASPIVETFLEMYETRHDDRALETAFYALANCARVAARHRLFNVLDNLIEALAQLTSLQGQLGVREFRLVDIEGTGERIAVSRLAVRFGQNYKGQIAAILLFKLVNELGETVRHSWTAVWDIIRTVFCCALLPTQMEDLITGAMVDLPLKMSTNKPPVEKEGWFSYLLPSYTEPVWEPTEGELEYSRRTCRCISTCVLDQVFVLRGEESLKAQLEAFLASSQFNSQEDTFDALDVFTVEMTVKLGLLNLNLLWPRISEFLLSILVRSKSFHYYLVKRVVVSLIRIALYSPTPAISSQAIQMLGGVVALPPSIFEQVAEDLSCGLLRLAKKDSVLLLTDPHAETVISLLCSTTSHPDAAVHSFETVKLMFAMVASDDLFVRVIKVLVDFASAAQWSSAPPSQKRTSIRSKSVERAIEAIELLVTLHSKIDPSSKATPSEVWSFYSYPILAGLSRLCCHPVRDVRLAALQSLHRSLLLPSPDSQAFIHSFDRILFPLLEELLRPEVRAADPAGIDDMRIRVASFLCNFFLQYLPQLLRWDGLVLLWTRLLDLMSAYFRTGNELLVEAIAESLKNVILVLSASDAFPKHSPTSPNGSGTDSAVEDMKKRALWIATWERVDAFLPGLKESLSS